MLNSMEMISIYENVAEITDRMLIAAKSADWDLLTELERTCYNSVQEIQNKDTNLELPLEIKNKKIAIIKKILADDKEIRDITEPWMLQLSKLMKNSESNRKLSQSYGNN
ncbi:flagellar protein FliT [Undibacterium sp.]|jgi:flagellar protein FliT|uniref:flagellar protein FliT n=1 Tax=Undibacterium sp. TaxID=1914977 RepID=UPI0025D2F1F9|nr:flagellar protein FliT [Undibacterium sp.]